MYDELTVANSGTRNIYDEVATIFMSVPYVSIYGPCYILGYSHPRGLEPEGVRVTLRL